MADAGRRGALWPAVTEHAGNRENQAVIREAEDGSEPLGRSRLPHFLAVTVAGIGLVAAAIVLLSALGRH